LGQSDPDNSNCINSEVLCASFKAIKAHFAPILEACPLPRPQTVMQIYPPVVVVVVDFPPPGEVVVVELPLGVTTVLVAGPGVVVFVEVCVLGPGTGTGTAVLSWTTVLVPGSAGGFSTEHPAAKIKSA